LIAAFDRRRLPPPPTAGRVVTIGVFDGVHVGHAAILATTAEQARAAGGEAAVVTFRRHPKTLLAGSSPPLITSLEHRLALFERHGVDLALALAFDEEIRDTSAEDFLRKIVRDELGGRALVLGPDSRFGKGRRGDAELAKSLGFPVTVVSPVLVGGARASSGVVRKAIAEGRLDDAAALLGRQPSLLGTVVHGDGRGRSIGFATANLDLHHELKPPRGVYAGAVELEGCLRAAVLNLGVRPTVDGTRETVEVHVSGWSRDLYGSHLEVFLFGKLRDEKRFDSLDALRAQIARDAAVAESVFAKRRESLAARPAD